MKNKFKVYDIIERRNDNPDLLGYAVNLNNKNYVVYLNKHDLKEVYFLLSSSYFMSCREDMKTISHYYIKDGIIKRYENGKLNRTYHTEKNVIWCYNNDKKIIYTSGEEKVENKKEIYNYLIKFLKKFNKNKLYKLFSPEEPKMQE